MLIKLGTTWARKGKTPCIFQGCRYKHLSAISPINSEGELYYQIRNTSFTGEMIVVFLRELLLFFNNKLRWRIEYLFKHLKTNGYNLED